MTQKASKIELINSRRFFEFSKKFVLVYSSFIREMRVEGGDIRQGESDMACDFIANAVIML